VGEIFTHQGSQTRPVRGITNYLGKFKVIIENEKGQYLNFEIKSGRLSFGEPQSIYRGIFCWQE